MSLSPAERRTTSAELHANLELSAASIDDVAADLDLDAAEVRRTLDIAPGSRPELVWLLRDHLNTLVLVRGLQPHPYTHLSESMRAAAASWFPLRPAPGRRP